MTKKPQVSLFDPAPLQTKGDKDASQQSGSLLLSGTPPKTSINNQVSRRYQRAADEVNFQCERQSKVLNLKYYLSDPDRRELIRTISDSACLLFDYYLRMASKDDREITDSGVAYQFGWSEQKVQRNRLALEKAGWFRRCNFSYSDGRKGTTFYIGKAAVEESRKK